MNRLLQIQAKPSSVAFSSTPVRAGFLQRKCACGQSKGNGGECADCRKKRQSLQRKTETLELQSRNDSSVPPIVHKVLRSPGQPLDSATLAFMEPRFGYDFSGVRVHANARAAESARAVNALAYTVGRDVVFGAGQYAPGTAEGHHLLTHELAHVVQQQGVIAPSTLLMGDPASSAESEAESAAHGAQKAQVRETAPPSLQRQPQPDDTSPRNVGPPLEEAPLPPRCSIIWKDGKWSWKCEGIPKIGSTPEIPLDPRDIPGRVKELLPKGPGGTLPGGQQTFPVPPTPGSNLPPNWMEDICKRNPMSPLCITLGGQKSPDQPKPTDILARPTGVFWTFDVLFDQNRPSLKETGPNGGMTAGGASTVNTVVFLLNSDPTMQVRLVGHASSEGDPIQNLDLSKRRARLVHQKLDEAKLGGQVVNPIAPDGKTEGCKPITFGIWACGELRAASNEARPEERKVEVTFLRNPPLPSGPLKLTPPTLLRPNPE